MDFYEGRFVDGKVRFSIYVSQIISTFIFNGKQWAVLFWTKAKNSHFPTFKLNVNYLDNPNLFKM